MAAPIPDGVYEAFVVDATADPDRPERVRSLEITIVSGEYKGESFRLGVTGVEGSDTEVMGMPATLTVAGGAPTVTIDG